MNAYYRVVEILKSPPDIWSDRVTGFVRPDNSLSDQILFTFLNKQTIYMNCKVYCFLQHYISYSLTNDLSNLSFSLSDCSFSLSLFSSFTSLSQSLNPCLPHFLSLPYFFLNLPQHLSHWHFHASIIIYLLYCLCLCLTQIELPVVFRSRNESFAGRPTLLNIMNIKTP